MKSKNGIIGFAIGDALGVPFEFKTRQQLKDCTITDMKGFGTYNVPKGTWSDDTSMTLATMDSVIQQGKIDTEDMASKFLKWFRKAEYTATGKVFDIGTTTLQALAKYELNIDKARNCGLSDELSNGNGSLMRILPIAYYCYNKNSSDDEVKRIVQEVSSITHSHEISIFGCYLYVKFAIELLKGKSLVESYFTIKTHDYSTFNKQVVCKYDRILKDEINQLPVDEIKSTGYIVDTLETVFWLVLNSSDYNETIKNAVYLGEDTDTVSACTGGILGIYYGINAINKNWLEDLLKLDYIEKLCKEFDNIM